ncbi:MAG TPA: non-canonical purine NTP pyrophosphatase, partial [Pirellulales bacterium]|nr:non-canonical purine NTP pyrophosphatase [Pirellulales bacterium]
MTSFGSLVVGTYNRKKEQELRESLKPLGVEVASLADFPHAVEVDETGDTFEANARLKAVGYARQLGRWVLADDSGLAVDALEGAPGVLSARFAGLKASDDANNRKLLDALRDVPPERRTAHYVCHATLSDPQGNVLADAEDYCHGRI